MSAITDKYPAVMYTTDANKILLAQTAGADIELETPGLRPNVLAQEIDQRTGVGMDAARLALADELFA